MKLRVQNADLPKVTAGAPTVTSVIEGLNSVRIRAE
jgi:hypothetical protein